MRRPQTVWRSVSPLSPLRGRRLPHVLQCCPADADPAEFVGHRPACRIRFLNRHPTGAIDSAPRTLPERSFSGGGYLAPQRPAQASPDLAAGDMAAPATLPLAGGTGSPGDRQLEGPQTPQLTIEKTAPKEIQVGKPATFVVKVRNTGRAVANDVEIRDQIPRGTQLQSTNPRASQGPQGELIWKLGAVEPNAEHSVEIVLVPIDEGEVGSVATVHFNAAASARTIVTKPQLALQVITPGKSPDWTRGPPFDHHIQSGEWCGNRGDLGGARSGRSGARGR